MIDSVETPLPRRVRRLDRPATRRRTTPAAAAAIGMVLLLGACSNNGSSTSDTTAVAAAETTAAAAVSDTTAAANTDTTAVTDTNATDTTGAATTNDASTTTTDATPAIVSATNAFLETLSADQKTSVQFEFSNTEQRQRWSNLPEGLFSRSGVMWGDLSDDSKTAWLAVMQATLSQEGYDRVMAEWSADDQLANEGGGGGLQFGKQYYWVALIGTPSATDPWQWQWGGHHVTVNATIVGTEISLTPSFIGVQPATYTDAAGKTVRPLGDIEDEAFAVVNALDATQKTKAVLGDTLIDLVLGPGADGRAITAEGLKGSDMTADQKTALLKLMGHYGGLINDEDAAARMADLKANLDETYFAWYGPTTAGSGIYFRVSGPTIVIEYSGQSMGGDEANHIHGIYRDPTNDYGAELGAGIS